MKVIRLHAPGITCLVWAAVWALGVRGAAVVVVGLTLVGLGYIDAHMGRIRSRTEQERVRSLWWVRLILPVWIERLWLVVLTGVVLWAVWAQAQQTDRTTRSLCAFRHDLENRVRQTDAFLRDHPGGFAGIPAATLRVSENGQVRTIQALSDLECR